ncbi:hypothetical protein GOC80_13335 [Sinorhizobium medicae]|nr:hypothetical protein [Sinorhizobium medicae]
MGLAARRIVIEEVEHGRTWSISGFKLFTAYPSPASSAVFCSFEDIKELSVRDGVLVLRAMETRSIRSFRRADVEEFATRKAEIDKVMTEISADH